MVEWALVSCIVLVILPYIAAALVNAHINSIYRGYLGTKSQLGIDANELLERAAHEEGFSLAVFLDGYDTKPSLTDCYDDGAVYLSYGNYLSKDVVSLAVAAHEFGHAMQDFKADGRFVLRTSLLAQPTLGFTLGVLALLFGWMLEHTFVIAAGAILWVTALVIDINTLKNEYDASRIARELLEAKGMPRDELALCDHIWKICAQSYLIAIFKHMATAIILVCLVLCAKKKE